jgi:hypothetical protein
MPRRGLALRSRSYLSTSASAPAPCSGSRLRWRWHVTGLRRAARDLSLWIVIVAGGLIWVGHPSDQLSVALEVIFKAALPRAG